MGDILNEKTEGNWNSERREAAREEMLRREEIHGMPPDEQRMSKKMTMLIEFDSRMREQGADLTIMELFDQLERLERHTLIEAQRQQLNRDFAKPQGARLLIGAILFAIIVYAIVWALGIFH